MRGTFKTALAALVALGIAVPPAAGDVAYKRLGEYRGYPAEPTDRVRPCRRPQWHRRYAQQRAFHQAVAAGDAGTARRQYPRPADPHRQRRRRDGDREPAGIRHPGHAHRRHRLGHGRLQEPRRRNAAGHPAAWRRRQRLCGRAGLALDRRVPGPGSGRQASPAAFRPSGNCRTAPSSNARSNSRSIRSASCGSRCATPISPRPSVLRSRSTITWARRSPSRSIRRPCSSHCRKS